VAFTTILSDFLPALLANVPYNVIQTGALSIACTWVAVVIICIMFMVVVWSFLVSWPNMAIDPSTIAGAMYYVMDPATFSSSDSIKSSGGRSSLV
jgi:hypothetical protein